MIDVISRIGEVLCLNNGYLTDLLGQMSTQWGLCGHIHHLVGTIGICIHSAGTVWTYVCTVTTEQTAFAGS